MSKAITHLSQIHHAAVMVLGDLTVAEKLMSIDWHCRMVTRCGRRVYHAPDFTEDGMERIKLARRMVEHDRRHPGFIFRAIVEEWDQFRINRELY